MSSRWSSFSLALVVWFVCGCNSAGPPPQQIAVNVTPATITVRTGDTQQFLATVTGTTNQSVTWSVNGTPGGDNTNGTISLAGLYTPPAQIPAQNKILVTATSAADSSANKSSTVTLANPIALVSFVYPPTLVSKAPFSISVIGSKFLSGAQVLLGTTQLTTTFVDSSHLKATGTAQAAPGVLNLTVVNPMPDGTPSASKGVPVTIVNQRAAVRFLEQSTFGPNDAQLATVETGGMESFLTAQFQAPTSDVNYPSIPPGMNDVHLLFPTFFQNALNAQAGSDQLRQRVMFALNQIWMVSGNANHDATAKTILGMPLSANQTALQDLEGALDIIFKHPNLPPFVGRRMIQHLVTSNPSPAYVTRVANAFRNGTFTSPNNGAIFGSSNRGDMQALIAAVLLDPEARRGDDPTTENPLDGHLREPMLFVTNVLRAFHGTTDGNNSIVYLALDMGGEFLFLSPSVFNFFSPLYDIPAADFVTPPASPLSGPEFQIFTSASSLSRVNDIEFAIFNPSFDGSTRVDLSTYASIAGNDNDVGTMVDALNLQLLHGTMSAPMRAAVLSAVSAVPSSDPLGRA